MSHFDVTQVHHTGVLPVDISPTNSPPAATTIDSHATAHDILNILNNISDNHVSYTATSQHGGSIAVSLREVPMDMAPDYSEYSGSYGWWDPSGGIDYAGSNAVSDGAAPQSTDPIRQENLAGANERTDGTYVNVYFAGTTSDGLNGDNAVTHQLAQVTSNILSATPDNIQYVNVTATTNGVHDDRSDHFTGNAVDINQVNGLAISGAGKSLGLTLEAQALADPNTRYVEGPGGNWARSEVGGTWNRSADLPTMNNHVHWSTFKH